MKTGRIASIDIFRALTMLLMIFVNDFWTLHDIPSWLEHAAADEDRLGFSDIIFPAFLFIVGLSIPFAIDARFNKGQRRIQVFIHILQRSAALVIMGFYMVNLENFHPGVAPWMKAIWQVIMVIAFLLIWNNYRNTGWTKKIPVLYFQLAGFLILFVLALTYKGGVPGDPEWMKPHWWGILGLIGWAYLLCALVYFLAGARLWLIIPAWIVLYALNVQEFTGLPGFSSPLRLVVSASNYALVMSGVLASVFYKKLNESGRIKLFIALLISLAAISFLYGFAMRPEWGISKIRATPAWTAICAGISFAFFAFMYWIADIWNKTGWAGFMMPAGRSTLTCYLVPYIFYPTLGPLIMMIPDPLTGGIAGLVKSMIFALLVVGITGLLEKINIRLKI
ncbi:MAG: DUF5009 domain-containing protein [Bacteroidales bacterium]|jgi:predicted acyltransferase|nr:DUF5009 domain-containing protein [Bacteroidales bacterium]